MDTQWRNTLPPLAALRAFGVVGSTGSIRKAALEIGVDHAVISRHLATLERWVGVRLLHRSGEGTRLTEEGQGYHRSIMSALTEISVASQGVRGSRVGALKIWCCPDFASRWFVSNLAGFLRMNPDQEVDLRTTYDEPDLAARDVDIHIRLFTPGQPSVVDPLHAVSLTSCDLIPVASPEYLRRNGPVLNELDLMSHSLLHSSTDERWRNWFRARGYGAPVRLPGMCLGTGELSVRAAGEGLGVALTSHFLSAGELASGRVLEVKLAEHPCKKTQGCYLFVARSDRWSSPAIAGLRQWMLQQAAFTPRLVANEMTGEEPIRRAV